MTLCVGDFYETVAIGFVAGRRDARSFLIGRQTPEVWGGRTSVTVAGAVLPSPNLRGGPADEYARGLRRLGGIRPYCRLACLRFPNVTGAAALLLCRARARLGGCFLVVEGRG